MLTKLIDYAYPTSDTAKKAGKYETGCYVVSLFGPHKIQNFADTKQEAESIADSIPCPYHWLQRFHCEHSRSVIDALNLNYSPVNELEYE